MPVVSYSWEFRCRSRPESANVLEAQFFRAMDETALGLGPEVGLDEAPLPGPRFLARVSAKLRIPEGATRASLSAVIPFLPDRIGRQRSLAVPDPKTRRFFLGALTAASAVR